jgi:signal peptidase I
LLIVDRRFSNQSAISNPMSLTRRILIGSDPRRTAVRVLVLAALSFVIFRWVLLPIRAQGISMLPTYESGTLHLVNRFAFASRGPARGDVVAIRLAGPHVLYVKRVVGLPGERVAIGAGDVHINGAPLPEPYVRSRKPWDVSEVTLTSGEYFVIGDNRGMSAGDHDFGRVEAVRIVGKVVF